MTNKALLIDSMTAAFELADCMAQQIDLIQHGWLEAERHDLSSVYRAIRGYDKESELPPLIREGRARVATWDAYVERVRQQKITGVIPKPIRR